MEIIITIQDFTDFQPNSVNKYTSTEIQSAINLSYTLLDAECAGAITDRWPKTSTEEGYLTPSQKEHIKSAFKIQTQYVLMCGLDFSQGTDQMSLGSFNMSSNRPNRNLISPQALKELQLAGIWYQADFIQARNGKKHLSLQEDMDRPIWEDKPLPESVSDQRYLHRVNTDASGRVIAYDNQGVAEHLIHTPLNTPNTIVERDANGNIKAADPLLDNDVVTKHYLDSQGSGKVDDVLVDGNSVVVDKIAYVDLTGKQNKVYYGSTEPTSPIDNDIWVVDSLGGGSQKQADWAQTDTTAVDYIKNKPVIPTIHLYRHNIYISGSTPEGDSKHYVTLITNNYIELDYAGIVMLLGSAGKTGANGIVTTDNQHFYSTIAIYANSTAKLSVETFEISGTIGAITSFEIPTGALIVDKVSQIC